MFYKLQSMELRNLGVRMVLDTALFQRDLSTLDIGATVGYDLLRGQDA